MVFFLLFFFFFTSSSLQGTAVHFCENASFDWFRFFETFVCPRLLMSFRL